MPFNQKKIKKIFRFRIFTLRIFLVLGEANRAAPILGAFQRTQTLLEGLQDVPLSLTFVWEAILQAFHRSLCGVSTPRIECRSIHLPMDSKYTESEILHPKKFEKKFRFFVLWMAAAIFPHRATPSPLLTFLLFLQVLRIPKGWNLSK